MQAPDRVVVLESFGEPHGQTNPYSIQLFDSFPEEVEALHFSWRLALLGSYEVFHLHWPEVKVRGTSSVRALLRGSAFLVLLLRIRVGRKALVRTLHDSAPHERPNALQRWVIGLSERWTTLWIVLNSHTRPPTDAPSVFAPIGHYRDRLEDDVRPDPVPGRIVHFGLIRPYKGVEALVDAFGSLEDQTLRLRIVGTIQDDALRSSILSAADTDARISVEDRYLPERELVGEVCTAELVVLPFARITNSSSLLFALSLGRPVLAPAAPSIVEVASEVGADWVLTYEGPLRPEVISDALERVRRSAARRGSPDLSSRDWPAIGRIHADAFRRARDIARHS
ncbi:MAG: glycosyltransferase [Microthrixaceae bacterium]